MGSTSIPSGWRATLATLLLLAGTSGHAADVAKGAAIAAHGTPSGTPDCLECHGNKGEGQAEAGIPRLAGLNETYLKDQLAAFAGGTRDNAMMTPVAKTMDAASMADAAAYYASLAPPPVSAPGKPTSQLEAGQRLALRGDWAANIPACASCHGTNGLGVGTAFPPVAGQSSTYIGNQLRAWRSGARHDDPFGLMKTIASRLDDARIAAVAAYYESLPAASADAHAKYNVASPSRKGAVATPPDRAIPNDEFGQIVKLGEAIFDDTAAHAGPYVGNTLSCANCHLDGGRLPNSAPMGAAYVEYPAYRMKNGHVNTFEERLQGCFRYSMNGTAPPLGDKVLVALEAYSFALAKGAPTGEALPGRGYPKLPKPAQGQDFARGEVVFGAKCAICHGADGLGQKADGQTLFPPLWGAQSYNWGAGMAAIGNAAGFIKANMPLGQGYSLTDQEAWDVATYIDSHERPQDPRFTKDVTTTREKFHDDAESMYGRSVNGVVLGETSPPFGVKATASEAPTGPAPASTQEP